MGRPGTGRGGGRPPPGKDQHMSGPSSQRAQSPDERYGAIVSVIRQYFEEQYTAQNGWDTPETLYWDNMQARWLMEKYQLPNFTDFTNDELNRASESAEATARFYDNHPEVDPRKREARHKVIVGLLSDRMAEEFEKHRQEQDDKVQEEWFRPELWLRRRARDILRPYSQYNFTDREIDRAVAEALAHFDAWYYKDGVNPNKLAGDIWSDIWNTVVATIDSVFATTDHGKSPQNSEFGYVAFDPYYYSYTTSDSDDEPWSGHRRDGYKADSD
jgi:hypothetical protein